jgi:hypothetical protein
MRIKGLKKLLWVLNTLLVCGIVAYALFFFILGGVRRRGARTPEQALGKLPKATTGIKEADKVPVDFFRYIHELPINGDPPPPPVEDTNPEDAVKIPPLAQNYKLLWTKVDTGDPWASFAHLENRKTAGEFTDVSRGQKVDRVWKLVEVENDKAKFEDENGETVLLEVERPDASQLGSAPNKDEPDVPDRIGEKPKEPVTKDSGPHIEAVEVRPNNWEVPPEEVEYWDDFGEEIAEDVGVLTVTDPETKKAVGVQIKSIKERSILNRRGLKTGDILKSINGTPVRSRQDVLNYLKGSGKGLSRYQVVIERNGKDITTSYNVKR